MVKSNKNSSGANVSGHHLVGQLLGHAMGFRDPVSPSVVVDGDEGIGFLINSA